MSAVHLLLLAAERAALRQARLAARGCAQHDCAATADDGVGGVREHRGDVHAAGAAHIHEVAVGGLHQTLLLVLGLLDLRVGVQQVDDRLQGTAHWGTNGDDEVENGTREKSRRPLPRHMSSLAWDAPSECM